MIQPESEDLRTTRLWRQAQGVLGAGLWSVTHGRLRYPDGLFPLLAETGLGCTLTDTSGRTFVDWLMGWGTAVLGYRHPEVERAAVDALRRYGPLLPILHPLEVEAARQVRALVPCAERVAFGKNGSDVLGIAVRIARAATGREGVLVCGYHGFHDWYMASVPRCEGIPEALRHLVQPFAYNDLDGLRELFRRHGEGIAAVVLEPAGEHEPATGFLKGLRELTLDHEALLVFDEVMTAFRLGPGGAQQAYGVQPDLACLGKAMANGFALSALVGRREVLEIIARVGYGITFRGETSALAAARACLDVLAREPVAEHLARTGEALRRGFSELCAARGVEGRLSGPPARMTLTLAPAGGLTPIGLQTLLIQKCLERGVFTNGLFLPSYAHDDLALERTLEALSEALAAVGRAVLRRSFGDELLIPAVQVFHEDPALEAEDPA